LIKILFAVVEEREVRIPKAIFQKQLAVWESEWWQGREQNPMAGLI
jgi:hypothetical protein